MVKDNETRILSPYTPLVFQMFCSFIVHVRNWWRKGTQCLCNKYPSQNTEVEKTNNLSLDQWWRKRALFSLYIRLAKAHRLHAWGMWDIIFISSRYIPNSSRNGASSLNTNEKVEISSTEKNCLFWEREREHSQRSYRSIKAFHCHNKSGATTTKTHY